MQISRNGVFRGIALLAVLVTAGLPSAFADETSGLSEPPQARILPVGGLTSQARIGPVGGVAAESRILPPSGVASESRIKPPSGDPEADSRIRPPGGAPSEEPGVFELLLEWLRARAGIQPPVG
ncbi:MAG TPA: hypothetical protein VF432_26260 [Thermoanaerobaculia bacterium]